MCLDTEYVRSLRSEVIMALCPSELNQMEYEQSKRTAQEATINGKPIQKLYLAGRSEAGKTTLIQALKDQDINYDKTQYVNTWDIFIDTPGEYYESKYQKSSVALCCFSFESDIVGILCGADEPFSILGYGLPTAINRPLIGVITKVDAEKANVPMARQWLENAGVYRIFEVDSVTGRGVEELRDFLLQPAPDPVPLDRAMRLKQKGLQEWESETN